MYSFISFFLVFALASRALAFNITVGEKTLTTAQILNVPDSVVKTTCATTCNNANQLIQACNDDAACLCRDDTVNALFNCEQCMFTKLVEENLQLDFRVGSAAVLSAYSGQCKAVANITLAANQTSLQLPASWDGPFVAVLPFGAALVVAAFGGIFGISAILLLSNM
ncbi:hypothetical protein H0H81_006194 [Sphagnurus paluster]|uniref:Transmembrane protein n=1 Tax=Sphagnurus paluster TaxID=117069 RepID=A0A9P7K4V8_9AGAR|nr:hypothetical protein H0H81_006194 [Sphagnurus paluster]